MIIFLALVSALFSANSDFINDNLKSFVEFKLSNGIPVVIKQSPKTNTKSIAIIIKGGVSNTTADKAGMEKATFLTALYESQKYTNTDKIKILKNSSAGISISVGFVESIYSMNSLNEYFDNVFDLYEDLLINPSFKKEYFDEVITNLKNNYRQSLSDGDGRVNIAFAKKFLENHPYAANLPDLKTLDSFTLNDVIKHHKDNLIASRMLIFAAGNFDIEKFKSRLEAVLGKLNKGNYKAPAIPEFNKKREMPLLLDAFDELKKDASYIRCSMLAPNISNKDYWALAVAFDVFGDLGYDIIRGEHSLVYSFGTMLRKDEANYSIIYGFKTNDVWKFKKALEQTIEQLVAGSCAMKNEENKYKKLKDAIDFYRLSFQTEYYDSLQTNAAIAANMASSYMITKDYKFYLYAIEKINKITPEEIIAAAKKYIRNSKMYCAVSAHTEIIEALKKNNPYSKNYELVKF